MEEQKSQAYHSHQYGTLLSTNTVAGTVLDTRVTHINMT